MKLVVRVADLNGKCVFIDSEAPYFAAFASDDPHWQEFVEIPRRNRQRAVRQRRSGIDYCLSQVICSALHPDRGEFWPCGSPLTFDDMTGRAATALIDSDS